MLALAFTIDGLGAWRVMGQVIDQPLHVDGEGKSQGPALPGYQDHTKMDDRDNQVATALLSFRNRLVGGSDAFVPFLDPLNGRPADQRTANMFFLACISDYRQKADRAWEQARRFVEETMGDPEDIWRAIVKRHPIEIDWMKAKSMYGLHYLRQGHRRVYRIGRQIIDRYDGDARRIWESATRDEVLQRLTRLQVGPQISQMVVGILQDTRQIAWAADVKADVHVSRVLGRIVCGTPASPNEAMLLARRLKPDAPWLLDRPLFVLGSKSHSYAGREGGCCSAAAPECHRCFAEIRSVCSHFVGSPS